MSLFDMMRVRKRPPKVQVVFNPSSGDAAQSDAQLELLVTTLRELHIEPNVLHMKPYVQIPEFVADAVRNGAQFVIASGGDNTVDLVARGLLATRTALVIVPIAIKTIPPLPVMIDGEILETHSLKISRAPRPLNVMIPNAETPLAST